MIKRDPSINGALKDVRNRMEADLYNLDLKWKLLDRTDEVAVELLKRMIALRIKINNLPEEIKEDGSPSSIR